MQKIIPHLWFDTQALQAAQLYVSLFDDSKTIKKLDMETLQKAYDGLLDIV